MSVVAMMGAVVCIIAIIVNVAKATTQGVDIHPSGISFVYVQDTNTFRPHRLSAIVNAARCKQAASIAQIHPEGATLLDSIIQNSPSSGPYGCRLSIYDGNTRLNTEDNGANDFWPAAAGSCMSSRPCATTGIYYGDANGVAVQDFTKNTKSVSSARCQDLFNQINGLAWPSAIFPYGYTGSYSGTAYPCGCYIQETSTESSNVFINQMGYNSYCEDNGQGNDPSAWTGGADCAEHTRSIWCVEDLTPPATHTPTGAPSTSPTGAAMSIYDPLHVNTKCYDGSAGTAPTSTLGSLTWYNNWGWRFDTMLSFEECHFVCEENAAWGCGYMIWRDTEDYGTGPDYWCYIARTGCTMYSATYDVWEWKAPPTEAPHATYPPGTSSPVCFDMHTGSATYDEGEVEVFLDLGQGFVSVKAMKLWDKGEHIFDEECYDLVTRMKIVGGADQWVGSLQMSTDGGYSYFSPQCEGCNTASTTMSMAVLRVGSSTSSVSGAARCDENCEIEHGYFPTPFAGTLAPSTTHTGCLNYVKVQARSGTNCDTTSSYDVALYYFEVTDDEGTVYTPPAQSASYGYEDCSSFDSWCYYNGGQGEGVHATYLDSSVWYFESTCVNADTPGCFGQFGDDRYAVGYRLPLGKSFKSIKVMGRASPTSQHACDVEIFISADGTVWTSMGTPTAELLPSIGGQYDTTFDFMQFNVDGFLDGTVEHGWPLHCPPTNAPTFAPTFEPTFAPTFEPTASPTMSPTTAAPTPPTASPTSAPSNAPTTICESYHLPTVHSEGHVGNSYGAAQALTFDTTPPGWITNNKPLSQQWAIFDLGSVVPFGGIEMWSGLHGSNWQASTFSFRYFTVATSTDGAAYSDWYSDGYTADEVSSTAYTTGYTDFAGPGGSINARYVKIYVPGTNGASACQNGPDGNCVGSKGLGAKHIKFKYGCAVPTESPTPAPTTADQMALAGSWEGVFTSAQLAVLSTEPWWSGGFMDVDATLDPNGGYVWVAMTHLTYNDVVAAGLIPLTKAECIALHYEYGGNVQHMYTTMLTNPDCNNNARLRILGPTGVINGGDTCAYNRKWGRHDSKPGFPDGTQPDYVHNTLPCGCFGYGGYHNSEVGWNHNTPDTPAPNNCGDVVIDSYGAFFWHPIGGVTNAPTPEPTDSSAPTKTPTKYPTFSPTPFPTARPSAKPTAQPSSSPTTASPTTLSPTTASPTTAHPSSSPTDAPTTAYPTYRPTPEPTPEPTSAPTAPIIVVMDIAVSEIIVDEEALQNVAIRDAEVECTDSTCTDSLCPLPETSCVTTGRMLTPRGRSLLETVVTFTFDVDGGSPPPNMTELSGLLESAGATVTSAGYEVTVDSTVLVDVLAEVASTTSVPIEIESVSIDNNIAGPNIDGKVDSTINEIAISVASIDDVAASATITIETTAAKTAGNEAGQTSFTMCNIGDELRYDGDCKNCGDLNVIIENNCHDEGNDLLAQQAATLDYCTPYVCTHSPTAAPTSEDMCCICEMAITTSPTSNPTTDPTSAPSNAPSESPTTAEPTREPTGKPTAPTLPTCTLETKYCSGNGDEVHRMPELMCEFERCPNYVMLSGSDDEDTNELKNNIDALRSGTAATPRYQNWVLQNAKYREKNRQQRSKLKRGLFHRPGVRNTKVKIMRTDPALLAFNDGGVLVTSHFKEDHASIDFTIVDKPEYSGDVASLSYDDKILWDAEAEFMFGSRRILIESETHDTSVHDEPGALPIFVHITDHESGNECVINGTAGENDCLLDSTLRILLLVVGSAGAGFEEGTASPTAAPSTAPTSSPTTGAPSLSPTTASPTTDWQGELSRIRDTAGKEVAVVSNDGECADTTGCTGLLYSYGYDLCSKFAGNVVPKASENLDLTNHTFRMSNLGEPQGCSLDVDRSIERYYVVYSNGGTGTCSDTTPCLCLCPYTTDSPTASPTRLDVYDHTCLTRPGGYNGDADGATINWGVSVYDDTTYTLTIQPWFNWASSVLFANSDDFPNYQRQTTWTTMTKIKNYPYKHLAEHAECTFQMGNDGQMPTETLDMSVCSTVTTNADGYHQFDFYSATTTCYTNLTDAHCESSDYQDQAILYPETFHVSYNTYTTDHISQCRRTWQRTTLTMLGASAINILPGVNISSYFTVEQDDGTVTVPEQSVEHFIYQDIGDYTITAKDWHLTPVIDTLFASDTVIVIEDPHEFKYDLDNEILIQGKTIRQHVADSFDTLVLTHEWQRWDLANSVWRDMNDAYDIDSNQTVYDTGSFAIAFNIVPRSQLFVEEDARILYTLSYSTSAGGGRRLLEAGESWQPNNVITASTVLKLVRDGYISAEAGDAHDTEQHHHHHTEDDRVVTIGYSLGFTTLSIALIVSFYFA